MGWVRPPPWANYQIYLFIFFLGLLGVAEPPPERPVWGGFGHPHFGHGARGWFGRPQGQNGVIGHLICWHFKLFYFFIFLKQTRVFFFY